MARAISSLPVPDSPVISTRVRVGATLAICANSAAMGALLPTISKRSSVSARRPCHLARHRPPLERVAQRHHQPLAIERLLHEVVGARLGRAHGVGQRARAPRS